MSLERPRHVVSTDAEGNKVVEVVQEDEFRDGDARAETGSVPASVRAEVMARDGGVCRFCGSFAENPAVHHVKYRSAGGKNHPDNLISVHWMFAPRCHEKIHSNKGLWAPLGLQVIKTPGATMLQLARWQRTRRRT